MASRPPGTLAAAGTCGIAYVAVVTLLSLSLGRAPAPTASLLWAYLLVLAGVAGGVGAAASALLALIEGCWRRLERPAGRLGLTFMVWAAGVFALSVAQRETTGIGELLTGLLYSSLALLVLIPVSGLWLRRRVDALGSRARAALGGVLALLPALPIAVHFRFPEQYPFSHAIGAVYASAAAAVGLRLLRVPLPRARAFAVALPGAVVVGALASAAAPLGLSPRLHSIPPVHGLLAALSLLAPDRDVDGFRAAWGLAAAGDCDDGDPTIHPLAPDPPGDGGDQNCFAGDVPTQARVLQQVCRERRVTCDEGARAPTAPSPKNIVFLTIDAWIYERGARGGVHPEAAPFLASLLDEALYAEEFRTCASSTTTSTDLNWSGVDLSLPKGEHPSFVALLAKERGYRAYEASSLLMPPERVGYRWDAWGREISEWYATEDEQQREFVLDVLRRAEPPFFLHAHLLSLHRPRKTIPPCNPGDGPRAIYLCQLRRIDRIVRELVEALWAEHGKEGTVVVLHGDHGEDLRYGHATSLREHIVHTPLLFVGGDATGPVIGPAGCMDILPTTFDLAGICDPRVRGPSLARRNPPLDRAQLMLIGFPTPYPPSLIRYAVRLGGQKLTYDLRSAALFAYDVERDPEEASLQLVYEHPLLPEVDAWMSLHRAALMGTDLCGAVEARTPPTDAGETGSRQGRLTRRGGAD